MKVSLELVGQVGGRPQDALGPVTDGSRGINRLLTEKNSVVAVFYATFVYGYVLGCYTDTAQKPAVFLAYLLSKPLWFARLCLLVP